MKDLYRLARTAVWLAFFGAIYQELRKPDAERTWHGKVAGVVPDEVRLRPDAERRSTRADPGTAGFHNSARAKLLCVVKACFGGAGRPVMGHSGEGELL